MTGRGEIAADVWLEIEANHRLALSEFADDPDFPFLSKCFERFQRSAWQHLKSVYAEERQAKS